MASAHIKDFIGMQYPREGNDYEKGDYRFFNQQYATSSYIDVLDKDKKPIHDLNPACIFRPKDDNDIKHVIKYAKKNKIGIAIKSGGHQYSGASSCGDKNVQLDLSNTYRDLRIIDKPKTKVADDKVLVFAGVSNHLVEFLAYLSSHKLFVPTGQCAYVCLGGHGQTGGYGQLGRSFGLLGDYITDIRMINHEAKVVHVNKDEDPELFNAIRGGSPGNFGVITHYAISALKAKSYMGIENTITTSGSPEPQKFRGPRGIKAIWVFSEKVLKNLLSVVARMSDEGTTPRGFDLCVNVLSAEFDIVQMFPALKDDKEWQGLQDVISKLPEAIQALLQKKVPPTIILYAQWCPVGYKQKYDESVDAWFQQFRDLNDRDKFSVIQFHEQAADMADMMNLWLFPKRREFPQPYVKRTYATNSRTLGKDGWVDALVSRLKMICDPYEKLDDANEKPIDNPRYDNCKLSAQIQCFGGDHSMFYNNRDNGAAYSWRDSTVLQTVDCWYRNKGHPTYELSQKIANQWQTENDSIMIGANSCFSKTNRRVLWGSWGDWDMAKPEVWKTYYEDEAKYHSLGKVRAAADPESTFTANPFAIARQF
ncbi:6-hydroxy-D-nicotine oxidase [Fusarium heterosporum]|uniref:6-hydroxy-D-nicotine oxidase n=1 Tax=Fusarium heterosporum TaxID=42747 RepID=A0A8H5TQN1_FUSHE|nr:6-hydroxy-D-nicotine oxidase [Fusarium heterosporum]